MVVSPQGPPQAPCSNTLPTTRPPSRVRDGTLPPGCPQRRRSSRWPHHHPAPLEVSVKVPFLSHTLSPFLNTSPSTSHDQLSSIQRPRSWALPRRLAGYHIGMPGAAAWLWHSTKAVARAPRGGVRARNRVHHLHALPPTTTPATLPKNCGQFCIDSPPGISARGEGMRVQISAAPCPPGIQKPGME